ncbi:MULTISPECIES: hypothetical protein [Bacteroidales]|uniref:hypothetical protein n=1 Tax=Bacteroidales TaxID=171549 RepID=UPI0006D7C7CF|nr:MULTISPECIES: hypothetical protein [Bacteroidales]
MRFYKIPVEDLKMVDPDWEHRRMNVEGTEAIIHEEIFNELAAKRNEEIMTLSEREAEQTIPYPVYDSQSDVFKEMLSSSEWTEQEKEIDL